jgi:hypothetical protein
MLTFLADSVLQYILYFMWDVCGSEDLDCDLLQYDAVVVAIVSDNKFLQSVDATYNSMWLLIQKTTVLVFTLNFSQTQMVHFLCL